MTERPSDGMTHEALAAAYDEWAKRDGNTPGYNLQKARNYGDQAAFWKARAIKLGARANEYTEHYDRLRTIRERSKETL